MNANYKSINASLQVLTQCEMPRNVKLHLELQLLKIKTLLVSDAPGATARQPLEKDIFERILTRMRRLQEMTSENDTLVALMGDLRSVLGGLSGLPAAGAYERSKISATSTPRKQHTQ